NNTHS
ncbi:acetyl-CoA C-acetyltransferase family protein, partial [Vibrio parahaemolyticus V-223/04]